MLGKGIAACYLVTFACGLIWAVDGGKATADSTSIRTNCVNGVQAIAMSESRIAYACRESFDKDIYFVYR